MRSLPHLHDATLLRASLVWQHDARIEIVFRIAGPRYIGLVGTKAVLLSCPHRDPWGPSNSVNEVRGPESTPEGNMLLEVEMQSGDTLLIEAEEFSWNEAVSIGELFLPL